MRDYAELVKDARYCCISGDCVFCNRKGLAENWRLCQDGLLNDEADVIEELLAAEPPQLWTDEPIKGSEFMTHTQGNRGFEIHFRTDSAEKYMAVQEECRRQIGHAKPEPPKEVE